MENNTKDREFRVTRLFDAPVEMVWEVWTNPEHIKLWWGPNGFTNTISKMEVEPNGVWEFVMHGPDGVDYKNKSIYKEVIVNEKIVFEHVTGPKFTTTVLFSEQGDKTLLEMHMLFKTREEFLQTIKTYKADEGLKQNMEKLTIYLSNLKQSVK